MILVIFIPVPAGADSAATPLVAEISAGPRALWATATAVPSGAESYKGTYTFTVGEQLATGDWTLVGRLRAPGAHVSGRSAQGTRARAPSGRGDLEAGAVLAQVSGRDAGELHRVGVVASGRFNFGGPELAGARFEMTLFQ